METPTPLTTPALLAHLETHDGPLALPRGGTLCWDDADLHRAAYTTDPEGYALLGLAPGVLPWQRARVLLQILAATQAGLNEPARHTLARVAHVLTLALPPAAVITVLLALRRLRANHKHTTRAVLRFVLEHPEADTLIAARRPALADCFEHALGKATARGCARRIQAGDTGSEYLRRRLLRFLAGTAPAPARVLALYEAADETAYIPYEPVLPLDARREREPIVTTTNRGDIAATLVHLYRGGAAGEPGGAAGGAGGAGELEAALGRYVGAATAAYPRFEGSVALVLDVSPSMRGYGDREWALLSQAAALRMVLAGICDRLEVIETGSAAGRAAGGATDLATGVLDALATGPDLVAVVSDGYENLFPGDLARVAATLPRAGIATPLVLCTALFTGADDLTLRRPAPALPQRGFWHQDDFAELLPWMFGHCAAGAPWLRAALAARLDDLDHQAARIGGIAA
ncbi:hypothetical protein J4573_44055 [Actinomadura barringtoniae]|uniref:VWA domain-containing protein n=1 Tax=Actinomadura barringtoniae TaxID=1427535 RepID=A0A939PKS5_9ACTN|nr:hypothetical protein [Actinomadura barringtoniae]MBO2454127.1 hypothetical protein [Actinomadura barringtoniae]